MKAKELKLDELDKRKDPSVHFTKSEVIDIFARNFIRTSIMLSIVRILAVTCC